MLERFRHKAEFRIVKNLLLYSKNHAQLGLRAHFAQCAEELQIEHNLSLVPAGQIAQEFIDDNQIAFVRVHLGKGHHHIFDETLVVFDIRKIWNVERNSPFVEIVFDEAKEDFAQAHRHAADFHAQDFEFPGDAFCFLSKRLVLQFLEIARICGNGGEDAHQMRFTCAIIADDEHAMIVHDMIHLQLLDDRSFKVLGHLVAHDIRLDVLFRFSRIICGRQLDDVLNGMETDEL